MRCSSHKGFSENSQGERICRICHLAFGPASDAAIIESVSATSGDFIQLGCVCKDELGIAHVYCAEVWFKLKGNRLCEICGETAKNVSGVTTNGVMEEWNDRRFMDNSGNSSRRFGGCWRAQPYCNFLMACLPILVYMSKVDGKFNFRVVFVDAGVTQIDIETKTMKDEQKMREAQTRAISEHGELALITVEGPQSSTEERIPLRPPMLQSFVIAILARK
ncbi:uncharacterized protein LOC131609344 [Vicia villosa]|uniref:uncharacterized protein LOC131609344 n=1 Tax=Vicia villosa TaxID=3911 RepID=UPI00273C4369|nr:uncharacterized protein LOC131609344 [Vicia villosa]